MGCAASDTGLVPVEGGNGEIPNGRSHKAHQNGGAPIAATLPQIDDDIKISAQTTKGLAFEVPISEDDSLIKKHPPKRFQKLEDQQMSSLTHRLLDEKQAEAEQRRQLILNQRIQSAKSRQKVKKPFMGAGEKNGFLIESMNREPSTVEL